MDSFYDLVYLIAQLLYVSGQDCVNYGQFQIAKKSEC